MNSSLPRFLIFSLMMVSLFTALAWAGTTGKINGRVVDEKNGSPLPAVNVSCQGTTLGAITDMDGYYTILHVPPGTYTLTASVLGYRKTHVSAVRVLIDQTTPVNISLTEETLEGESVTIVAERRVVKEDVSTSVAAVSSEEIQTLPMTSVSQIVGLQAGVESGMVIRGGGAEEALFQMDGMTLRDPRTNQPIAGIALSAVKEISVERGGFNAEYGQVRSGLINVVTREGGSKDYTASFTFKYAPPARRYFGDSPFDANSYWLRSYLDPAVCWTGTENGAWDVNTQAQYPQFDGWNVISERLFTDDDPGNDLTPAAAQRLFRWQHRKQEISDQPDYNIDAGFGGPVPFIGKRLGNLRFFTSFRSQREMLLIPLTRDDYTDYNWSWQLTSDLKPAMKLRLSGLLGKTNTISRNGTEQQYSTQYVRTPDDITALTNSMNLAHLASLMFSDSYLSLANVQHVTMAAKLTHTLNPTTFYEASLEYIGRKYDTGPTDARDTALQYPIIEGYLVDEAPYGFSSLVGSGIGDGMFFGGHTSTARDSSRVSSTTLKFDLTSQVNRSNLIKTGVEFVYNDLDLDFGVESIAFPFANRYIRQNNKPLRGAVYLQDKLETKGFILNAGLRLDYSNANTDWTDLDPYAKEFYSSRYKTDVAYESKKAESRLYLSPRLGISHPITTQSKLFFNYGHFTQLPTYEQLFLVSRGPSREVLSYGDPNLLFAKTISYELGFDYSLANTYLIQVAAFYHDISDQLTTTVYQSADRSVNYSAANNNSYEDIRGFEATLRKTIGSWWTAFANYTYQVNTLGHFGKAREYEDPSEQREYDRETTNLYQERPIPNPYARASLTLGVPQRWGPKLLDHALLGDLKLNLIADWRSGWWATWNPNKKPAISQNVQVKDWYNLQLRLSKTFAVAKNEFTFFMDVENLFNTRRLNLNSFSGPLDYDAYFNSLHLPQSEAYNNIKGEDRVGDYRKDGVDFQPVGQVGSIANFNNPVAGVIYLDQSTGKYMQIVNGDWAEVAESRMQQIRDDKAYIDMPNHSSFNFLNPRRIFFGLTVSFNAF